MCQSTVWVIRKGYDLHIPGIFIKCQNLVWGGGFGCAGGVIELKSRGMHLKRRNLKSFKSGSILQSIYVWS